MKKSYPFARFCRHSTLGRSPKGRTEKQRRLRCAGDTEPGYRTGTGPGDDPGHIRQLQPVREIKRQNIQTLAGTAGIPLLALRTIQRAFLRRTRSRRRIQHRQNQTPVRAGQKRQGLPLRRLLCRRGRELRLPMDARPQMEPGSHRRRRIRTVQLRQVSLLRLRPAARIRKQKLFRPDQSGH